MLKTPVIKTVVTTIQFQQSNNSTQRFDCIYCFPLHLFIAWNQLQLKPIVWQLTNILLYERKNESSFSSHTHSCWIRISYLRSQLELCYVCANVFAYTRTYQLTHSHARTHVHDQRKFQHAHASLWYCVPVYFSHVDICYLAISVSVCNVSVCMHVYVYLRTNQFSNVAVSAVAKHANSYRSFELEIVANKKHVVF